MKVYKLRNDEPNYQELTLDTFDLFNQLKLSDDHLEDIINFGAEGASYLDRWGTVTSTFEPRPFYPGSIKIPNISVFTNSILLLSENAYEALRLILADYGEMLPITIQGFKYYLFNLQVSAKLDSEKSEYEIDDMSGDVIGIKSRVFDETDIAEKDIFTNFHNDYGGIYCTEGFKNSCEMFELDGLIFDEDLAG